MIQIRINRIITVLSELHDLKPVLQMQSCRPLTALVGDNETINIDTIKNLLIDGINIAEELGLEGSIRFSNIIIDDLNATSTNITNLCDNISKLTTMLESELSEQWFIYIPEDKLLWVNNAETFGLNVIKAFPSAREDIKEAGNCYAIGCPTACVFHAMRILEYGLKALAKEVSLTFDVQQWENIIDQIEAEIKRQGSQPKSVAKDERLQFLSEAAKQFTYFKDGWRNYVSHARASYDMSQAYSALDHVKSFMIQLSSRLRE